ncbi:MAG: hypothetical protein PHD32_11020, partial [Eubacteriales bacterium]|nr:hypothetical protein [Eubacteriales bacterium]
TFHEPDLLRRGAPLPENQQKLKERRSGEEITLVLPVEKGRRKRAPGRRSRIRIRWGRFTVALVVVAALCAALGYGGVLLYRATVGKLSDAFAGSSADAASDPLVEKVLINGVVYHRITFYGKDKSIVMVDAPRRSLTIENGKAELLLDDASLIGNNVAADAEVLEINLNASLFDEKGTETVVRVPPYSIAVPLSSLKLVSPQMQSLQTNEDRIVIKIKVTPGSRVLIGTKNVTDIINSEGYVSASVNVDAIGVNTIPITVETPQCRTNVFELKIDRPVMAVPITLDETVASTSETRDGVLTISGGTEAGAVVTTNADLSGDLQCNTQSGAFSFSAKLNTYGWNEIQITSTASDGRTSTMVHRVKRTPELDSYSKNAWVLDYQYLSTSPKALLGRAFVFTAQIIKEYSTDQGTYMLVDVLKDGVNQTQFLTIENSSDKTLEMGKAYKFYADVTGTYNDYPLLTVRFVYEAAAPSASATPAPTATPAPN